MKTARHSTDFARASTGELDLTDERFTSWPLMVTDASPPFRVLGAGAADDVAVEVYVETRDSPLEQ